MLKRALIVGCAAAACAAFMGTSARGGEGFPPKATYLYFIQGQPAGKSELTSTVSNGAYVFSSTNEVQMGGQRLSLTCRTEFDKAALRPRLFRYEGSQNGETVSGTVRFDADSIRASQEVGGTPMAQRRPWADGMAIFENYTTEHLAVIAKRLAESTKTIIRFDILFPSDMMTSPAWASEEAEIELPTRPTPVVCKKYVVSLENSSPFYLYVDTKSNSLLYMDFPATQTEVFLLSAFGEKPGTHYKLPPKPED